MEKALLYADTIPALMQALWERIHEGDEDIIPIRSVGTFRGAISHTNGKFQMWYEKRTPFGITSSLVEKSESAVAA